MTTYYNNPENKDLHKVITRNNYQMHVSLILTVFRLQLQDVQVGQIVAAVFRHDAQWYRGRVVHIRPNEYDERQEVCDVHFVDFGDNEFVAKEELFSLRTDMLKLRFQAVECFLAGVAPAPVEQHDNDEKGKASMVPAKWTNTAIQRFEDLTAVCT